MPHTAALTVGRRSAEHELLYRKFVLQVVEGPDLGLQAISNGEETTIGTDARAHLSLTDRTVSKHHAAIRATERGLELRDLGSKNGTVLGGHRIVAAFVQPGSLISCGRNVLRVDVGPEEVGERLSSNDRFGDAIGVSAAMRRVFALLEQFSPTESTVLLEGETGTGKEVLAHAIHNASPRANGPFTVVDLGALSPTLIESELFGHARGAFTGAIDDRVGALEAASGGTLFLDEIGEMPLQLQPLLLRALEHRSIKRVGEDRPIAIDVRVVAATNRDLRAEVNRSLFRADLYYRLAVLRVAIPPLRERSEDIPMLMRAFHSDFVERGLGKAEPIVLDELITAFSSRSWSGNVRELRSAVERALIVGSTTPADHGPPQRAVLDLDWAFRDAKEQAIACWELEYLRELVAHFGGNLARAARAVQMSRSYLSRLVAHHGLRD